MAYDGSGNFTRPASDVTSGSVISSAYYNTEQDGIATGLTNALTKDGQSSPSANLPMNSKKLTGMAVGTATSDSVTLGQAQAEAYVWCGTAGGTADAITLAPTPALASYAAGMRLVWIAGASPNTGAMTINASALGAKAAQNDESALIASDHAAGKMYVGIYDGTQFQISRFRLAPIASATVPGITEYATTAETETGTDAARSVTPDGLHDMTTLSGAAWMLDEDNMATDSATVVASQQSIKAYVDAQATFVSTAAIGAAASINTGTLVAGYDYIIQLDNFCPATDGETLWTRFSDDDGSTYEADAGDYQWAILSNAAATNDDADSEIHVTSDLGNDSGNTNSLQFTLMDPATSGTKTTMQWTGTTENTAATPLFHTVFGGGAYVSATDAHNKIQFLWGGATNFKAQGNMTIWRRKRS